MSLLLSLLLSPGASRTAITVRGTTHFRKMPGVPSSSSQQQERSSAAPLRSSSFPPVVEEVDACSKATARSSNRKSPVVSLTRKQQHSTSTFSLVGRTCRPNQPTHTIPNRPNGSQRHNNSYYHSSSIECTPYRHLDREAVTDLFQQYAKLRDGQCSLDANDIVCLLKGIGEPADDAKIEQLFQVADLDGNGVIDLDEFLDHADTFIGDNPARIILVIGGPGSGKGVLSRRLETECNVVHLSSGSLLREEVQRQTPLGRQVQDMISQGQLVSSAIMVALMKKRMRDHPGKRVLLDGFPRSPENAHDLVTLCGKPELALHLVCDDTILMERIMKRGENRQDDNFDTALNRIRTYHRYHHHTLEWLREQHVPIVNLDCTGPPESVWHQMTAIGKLMRPAVKLSHSLSIADDDNGDDWSSDPQRTSALF